MKIIFLCSSLEPGKDGVGDYVRRLSVELIRRGHSAEAIALFDRYIGDLREEVQKSGNLECKVLRIPAGWSSRQKLDSAGRYLEKVNPDWISLQYVPYGFHDKGFPFLLAGQLKKIVNQRQFHIMFHETWVGKERKDRIKLKVTSILQQMIIKRMIRVLKPELLHTQLPVNQQRLEHLGFETLPLPLFSNIPLVKDEKREKNTNTSVLRVGFFSQMEISPGLTQFLKGLDEAADFKGIKLEILLIGGQRGDIKALSGCLKAIEGFGAKIKSTGFLSEQALSFALQTCSLGISPVPRHALGKSGSVAAFIAHGIPVAAPVVSPGYDAGELGFFSDDLRRSIVTDPDLRQVAEADEVIKTAKEEIDIHQITCRFLLDLKQISNI